MRSAVRAVFLLLCFSSARALAGGPCKAGEKVLLHCINSDTQKPRDLAICATSNLSKTKGALYVRTWRVGQEPDFVFPREPTHPSEVFTLEWEEGGAGVNGGSQYLVFEVDGVRHWLGTYFGCDWSRGVCRRIPESLSLSAAREGGQETLMQCYEATGFPSRKVFARYGIPARRTDP